MENIIQKEIIKEEKKDTKKSLKNELEIYRRILNKETTEYLNALIELEFSAIRGMDTENHKALSDLALYKKIITYNITQRALNLLSQETPINVKNQEKQMIISTSVANKNIRLLELDFREVSLNQSEAIRVYKEPVLNIRKISHFQTLEDKKVIENELETAEEILKDLEKAQNPRPIYRGRVGNGYDVWKVSKRKKINDQVDKIKYLKTRLDAPLSDEEKREIEITRGIFQKFLIEYGLTEKDFQTDERTFFSGLVADSKSLEKSKVKRFSNVTIKNNIKYI